MSFLFDEQISPRVSNAIREMGEPANHVYDVDELGRGAKDHQILPHCGRYDVSLVTLDRKIATLPHYISLVREFDVRVFFVSSQRRKETPVPWEILKIVVKHWEEMKRIHDQGSAPFMKLVKWRGTIRTYRGG